MRAKKAGRPATKEWERVLRAVAAGAQDGPDISRRARIPWTSVHPYLNRLRARGLVRGMVGTLRVTARGRKRLGPARARR